MGNVPSAVMKEVPEEVCEGKVVQTVVEKCEEHMNFNSDCKLVESEKCEGVEICKDGRKEVCTEVLEDVCTGGKHENPKNVCQKNAVKKCHPEETQQCKDV